MAWIHISNRVFCQDQYQDSRVKCGLFCMLNFFKLLLFLLFFIISIAQAQENSTLNAAKKMQAWQRAVDRIMLTDNIQEHDVNASYKFDACFLQDDECVAASEAYRDEFLKTTFYYAPGKNTSSINHITFYISLKDGGQPEVIMRFVCFGDDWLHMKNVAVLVDNKLIFEQAIPEEQTRRDVLSMSQFYEYGDLSMASSLDVIEQIAQGKTIAVQISGRSQNAYLDKAMLASMQIQAQEILLMQKLLSETINQAHENVTPLNQSKD